MKKRIFSLVLALAMMVSVSTAFAAGQPVIGDDASTFYEGNKPFELIEKILIELNDDKNDEIFDKNEHANQYNKIESINVSSIDGTLDWYINNYLGDSVTDTIHKRQYLAALVKAYGTEGTGISADTNANALKAGLKNPGNDTTLKSMRESYGMLDDYVNEMKILFNDYGIDSADYTALRNDSKWYIAEPLKLVLEVIFANNKTEMRNKYFEFLQNDRAKKTLAVLFGAKLTGEIVNDTFLPGSETEKNFLMSKEYS